jgi:hypothetical protein
MDTILPDKLWNFIQRVSNLFYLKDYETRVNSKSINFTNLVNPKKACTCIEARKSLNGGGY